MKKRLIYLCLAFILISLIILTNLVFSADYLGNELREYFNDSVNIGTSGAVFPNVMYTQSFQIGTNGTNEATTISYIWLYLTEEQTTGGAGTIHVDIYATNASNNPTGASLGHGSKDVSGIGNGLYSFEQINMTAAVLDAGTNYTLHVWSGDGDSNDNVKWVRSNATYSNADHPWYPADSYGSSNNGTLYAQLNDYYYMFEIWGQSTLFNVTLDAPSDNSAFYAKSISFNATTTFPLNHNLTNATFYIWNSTGEFNVTTNIITGQVANKTNINISGFVQGEYEWNVLSCGIKTLDSTNYSCIFSDANYSLRVIPLICVNISHPAYGVNYSCSMDNDINFLFNISYFRRNELNDSSIIKNVSWVSGGNQTVYIEGHQYDEIDNVTINVSGYITNSTYPTDVKIYINNTLSNDLGFVFGAGKITLDELNDGSVNKSLDFYEKETKIVYLRIPKKSSVSSAYMNLSGFQNHTWTSWYNEEDSFSWSTFNNPVWTPSPPTNVVDEDFGTFARCEDYTGPYDVGYCDFTEETNITELQYASEIFNVQVQIKWDVINVAGFENKYTFCGQTFSKTDYIIRSQFFNVSGECGLSKSSTSVEGYNKIEDNSAIWRGAIGFTYETQIRANFSYTSSNITLDLGVVDGVHEFENSGEFSSTNRTDNINTSINSYLDGCTADVDGYCDVPIYLTSASAGRMYISNISINYSYNPNPVVLDKNLISSFLGNETGFSDIPITFESAINGTLIIDDIRYDYAGGNDTITITTYEVADPTNYDVLEMIVYYSDWDYAFPQYIDWLEFIPKSPTAKNVTPYGQTNSKPILNITSYGYGGKNTDFSTYLNETHECVDLFISTNNTKPKASLWDGLVSYWSFDIDARDNQGDNDGTVSGATLVSGGKQDGLVSWWKFDAPGDLQDYAETNPGTNFGANWISSGKYSGAYEFDGVNDYVDLGSWTTPFDNTTSYSIFAWAYAKQFGGTHSVDYIFYRNDDSPALRFDGDGDRITFQSDGNNGGTVTVVIDKSDYLNTWKFVGFTYDYLTGNLTGYVDGVEIVSSIEPVTNAVIGSRNVKIGWDSVPGRDWNGSIDDVRIYNKSLDSNTILALYERRLETLGNAYEFDGINNKITIETVELKNSTFTSAISWWMKTDQSGYYTIFSKDANQIQGMIELTNGTGQGSEIDAIRFEGNTNNLYGQEFDTTGINPRDGSWHNFVININSTNVGLYSDGILTSSKTIFNDHKGINVSLMGVAQSGSGTNYGGWFNGSIDEVRIYNKSLSASEISILYERSRLKYYDTKLKDDWNIFSFNKPYLFNEKTWMWADYSCNYTTWKLWEPDLLIRGCCIGCICSEDIV